MSAGGAEVRLVPLTPAFSGAATSVPGTISIGRAASCQCHVVLPSVSRLHATIVASAGAAGEGPSVRLAVTSQLGVFARHSSTSEWRRLERGSSLAIHHGAEILLVSPQGAPAAGVTTSAFGDGSLDSPHFAIQVELGSGPSAMRSLFSQAAEHDVLGRYEFLREVGRGTFGVCWHARERGGRRLQVAAKVISKAGAAAAGTNPAEVLAEAQVLAAMRHPNVLGLTHAADTPAYVIIVTDFCDGGGLDDSLARIKAAGQRLSDRACRGIAASLLRGLAYLHEKGVIHRDVKPANVLVQSPSTPSARGSAEALPLIRIADFGLAKFADRTGTRCGTPLYMAPELLAGLGYDSRADTFAAGVILHELLTGQLPWTVPRRGGMASLKEQILATGRPGFELPLPAGVVLKPASPGSAPPSTSLTHPLTPGAPVEVSEAGWSLVKQLVCPESDRLTAAEALLHPWIAASVSGQAASSAQATHLQRLTAAATVAPVVVGHARPLGRSKDAAAGAVDGGPAASPPTPLPSDEPGAGQPTGRRRSKRGRTDEGSAEDAPSVRPRRAHDAANSGAAPSSPRPAGKPAAVLDQESCAAPVRRQQR